MEKLILEFVDYLPTHFKSLQSLDLTDDGQSYILEGILKNISKVRQDHLVMSVDQDNEIFPLEEENDHIAADQMEDPQGWGVFNDASQIKVPDSEKDELLVTAKADAPQKQTEETKSIETKDKLEKKVGQNKNNHPKKEPTVKNSDQKQNTPKVEKKEVEQFLICHAKDQMYGVEVEYVKEILTNKVVQALPLEKKGLEGVVAVRGSAVPILDLSNVFGNLDGENSCTIICEYNKKVAGFRVKATSQVLRIHKNSVKELKASEENQKLNFLNKIAKHQDGSILLIDLNCLFG